MKSKARKLTKYHLADKTTEYAIYTAYDTPFVNLVSFRNYKANDLSLEEHFNYRFLNVENLHYQMDFLILASESRF